MKTYEKVLNLTTALELHNINPKDFAIVLTKSELEEFDKSMSIPKFLSPKNTPKTINGMLIHPVPDPVTPFDFESMPFPCVIRNKKNPHPIEEIPLSKSNAGVTVGFGMFINYKQLFEDWEWRSISPCTAMDFSWKPCTKESLK